MKPWCAGLALGLLFAGMAQAQAPERSLRPLPRPSVALAEAPAAPLAAGVSAAADASIQRPLPRPATVAVVAPPVVMAQVPNSLRPMPRPKNLNTRQQSAVEVIPAVAARVQPGKQVALGRKGSVCGDPEIRGEVLSPIGSRTNGCGIPDPVRITNVAGVRLSQAATVDCATAKALKKWIKQGVEPAYGKGQVVQLQIAGHYVCRTRNHRPGAKISEHGRGRAIDISGFTFSNGRSVAVLRNFDAKMRKAHKAACGIFGTTLGPGSDGMHEDHLHFDTARHRNGSYCR